MLCDVLARHTAASGRVWLAQWVGYGGTSGDWDSAPTVRAAARECWLFEAPLSRVLEHSTAFTVGWIQSPQLWWPDDHAWAVASEIDYDSTLVAGSVELAEALEATPGIECLRIEPTASLYIDADEINSA